MVGTGVLAPPDRADYAKEGAYKFAQSIYGLVVGQSAWGVPSSLTSYSSASTYSMTIENQGAGGKHLNVPNVMTVEDPRVTVNNLVVSGTLDAGDTSVANLTFSGNLLSTGLGKTFKADFSNATLANRFYLQSSTAAATGVGVLPGSGATSAGVALFNSTNLAAVGFLNLQMISTEGRLTVSHVGASFLPMTFYTGGAERARFAADGKFLVGLAAALTSATNDTTAMLGRLYVTGGSTGEELALGLRFNSSVTGSFFLGASNSNTPDLAGYNNGGTQIFRAMNGGGLIVGNATAMSGSETIRVQGQARIEGATTITTGGLTVTAGGVTITAGGLTVNGGNIDLQGGTAGQIRAGAMIVNAASLSGSESLRVGGSALIEGPTTTTVATFNGTNDVFLLTGTTQTLTTVGAAGGASALPATPLGYIKAMLGATSVSIPFYNR